MNQLKCTTVNCQHNLKGHCDAGVVAISDKAVCDSRLKRVGGALEQTFAELEAAEDMLQDAPSVVTCDAQCVYNKDGTCRASSLFVADTFMKTRCKTRVKPQ